MLIDQISSLVDALDYLDSVGFTNRFVCLDYGVRCVETKQLLQAEEFIIVGYYRFQESVNPDDASVVYAVTAGPELIRGVIVDTRGPYFAADERLSEHLPRMSIG